jgi:hypothetical protein
MLIVQKLPRGLQAYIITVVLIAVALLWVLLPSVRWEAWPEILMFTVLITVASMFPVSDPRGGYVTSTTTLMYVLLSVQAPGAVLLVAGTAYAIGHAISRGWVPWRTILNGAQIGLSVTLASLIFHLVGGNPQKPGIVSFLLPFVLAALAHRISNTFFVSSFFSQLRGTPLLATWPTVLKDQLGSNLLSVPAAALLSILYVSVHPATLLLYLISLPIQIRVIELYFQQRQIYDQAVDSLVVAVDANFPQGAGHSRRVGSISVAIARRMKLSDLEVEGIGLGALVHDVGMIGLDEILEPGIVPSSSLLGRLREHVTIGAEVTKDFPQRDVGEIVLYHHENYDGSGYPQGLKGDQIPLGARIVAVAETFDSMVSGGLPYTERISAERAVRAVQEQAGKALDPRIVDTFLAAVEAGELKFPDPSSTNALEQHLRTN